jgi:hypothetical protein
MAYRLEVVCVSCGEMNAHPAAVDEARQYHWEFGEHELVLEGEAFQIWDVCPRCRGLPPFKLGDPIPF